MTSLASTAILTKGLTGATPSDITACDWGNTIATPFGLLCRIRTRLPPSGGGPYPYSAHNRLEPGQIQNFYKPVKQLDELNELFKPFSDNSTGGGGGGQPFVVPLDLEEQYFGTQQNRFTVEITFNGKETSKQYSMSPTKNEQIPYKFINLTEKTYENIRPRIKHIRRKYGHE